jgi:HD-like signal output (HDOD) protein
MEDKNIAYTFGILHDIGRVALAVVSPAAYATMLDGYSGPADGILEAERALFGQDHCETGLQLVDEWRLPEELAPAVAEHHEPMSIHSQSDPAELVNISCKLADAAGFPAFTRCEPLLYEELLQALPEREQKLLSTEVGTLKLELTESIRAIESV